jgi:hypothetical protein
MAADIRTLGKIRGFGYFSWLAFTSIGLLGTIISGAGYNEMLEDLKAFGRERRQVLRL